MNYESYGIAIWFQLLWSISPHGSGLMTATSTIARGPCYWYLTWPLRAICPNEIRTSGGFVIFPSNTRRLVMYWLESARLWVKNTLIWVFSCCISSFFNYLEYESTFGLKDFRLTNVNIFSLFQYYIDCF